MRCPCACVRVHACVCMRACMRVCACSAQSDFAYKLFRNFFCAQNKAVRINLVRNVDYCIFCISTTKEKKIHSLNFKRESGHIRLLRLSASGGIAGCTSTRLLMSWVSARSPRWRSPELVNSGKSQKYARSSQLIKRTERGKSRATEWNFLEKVHTGVWWLFSVPSAPKFK